MTSLLQSSALYGDRFVWDNHFITFVLWVSDLRQSVKFSRSHLKGLVVVGQNWPLVKINSQPNPVSNRMPQIEALLYYRIRKKNDPEHYHLNIAPWPITFFYLYTVSIDTSSKIYAVQPMHNIVNQWSNVLFITALPALLVTLHASLVVLAALLTALTAPGFPGCPTCVPNCYTSCSRMSHHCGSKLCCCDYLKSALLHTICSTPGVLWKRDRQSLTCCLPQDPPFLFLSDPWSVRLGPKATRLKALLMQLVPPDTSMYERIDLRVDEICCDECLKLTWPMQ